MCGYDEPCDDIEMKLAFQKDQRKLYASGQQMYDCPDCGAEKAITAEMKRRGYHCDRCTRSIELGY